MYGINPEFRGIYLTQFNFEMVFQQESTDFKSRFFEISSKVSSNLFKVAIGISDLSA